MSRISGGVLAGIVLGGLYGVWSARGAGDAAAIVGMVLGRASQGIVNGILAAYFTPPRSPAWRGALTGGLIGGLLGALRGIPHQTWAEAVPLGLAVGIGCGVAASLAGRG